MASSGMLRHVALVRRVTWCNIPEDTILNFVCLFLSPDSMYYGITLTKQSKHHRNINFFGPTTLRATICYNMLRLAQPKAGDVIIDPLCGGGSIPIEV
jgi:23S rRNA G2445 N2-methylase RlmL